MNLSTLIILSLVANLGLLGGIMVVRQKNAAPTPVAADVQAATAKDPSAFKKAARKKGAKPEPDPASTTVQGPPEKFTWAEIEAADYKQYIANLRACECPEETIRDIILADVTKLYEGKRRALHKDPDAGKFWTQKKWWEQDRSVWRTDRALEKEKQKLLVELLGSDPQKDQMKLYGGLDYNERMYGFLPEEKRTAALEVAERFQDLEQESRRKFKGYWGEEVYAEQKAFREQRRAELAKILTAQELEEFELRNSNIANQMGWETRDFDPNEQEFRALFKVKQTFEDVVGGFGPDPDDKEAQKKWSDARKLMDDELKSTLGDGRFRDYKRSQDYQYQQLTRMAEKQNLPKDTAGKIYDLKDAADEQAKKVRGDQSLSSNQRRDALKAIQTEVQKSATELLGEKTFKSYRDRYGYWMRQF